MPQQRRVTVSDAARIVDVPEQALKTWRHRQIPGFAKLGELTSSGTIEVSLRDVGLMALTVTLMRQGGRTIEECSASAKVWQRALDDVFTAREVVPGEPTFAIELHGSDGKVVERFLAPGRDAFLEAMEAGMRAAAVTAVNLSELVARTQTGWLCVVDGVEATRAEREPRWRDLPAAERQGAMDWFDAIAGRVAPPKPARAPRPAKQQQPQVPPKMMAKRELAQ